MLIQYRTEMYLFKRIFLYSSSKDLPARMPRNWSAGIFAAHPHSKSQEKRSTAGEEGMLHDGEDMKVSLRHNAHYPTGLALAGVSFSVALLVCRFLTVHKRYTGSSPDSQP